MFKRIMGRTIDGGFFRANQIRNRGARFLVLLFLLIEFFDELHYAIGGAVLPALRTELALSYAQVGLILGAPYVIGTLIEPVLMLLGDTWMRKRLVIAGGLAIVISLVLIASTHAFPMLLFAMALAFPASGAFVSLAQATLMDLNPERETQMMARWTVTGSAGNLIGPLLAAGGFALGLGWRWAYLMLAVLALGLVLVTWPQPFPLNPATRLPKSNKDFESLSRFWETGNGSLPGMIINNLKEAINNAKLLRWVILLEFSNLLLDVFTGYVALYFTDVVGMTPAQASLVLSILMLTSLAADLLLIPLLERFPGRKLVKALALAALGIYSAWLLVPWPLGKVALLVAIRFSTMGWYPVLQGEAYAALPGRSGTVMAINSLAGVLGGGLAWLTGWIAGQAGLPAAMWLLLLGPLSLVLFVPQEVERAKARIPDSHGTEVPGRE